MSNSIDSTPAPDSHHSVTEDSIRALVQLEDLEMGIHQLTAYKLKVKATGNPYLLAHLLSHLGYLQTRKGTYEAARETLNEADFVLIEAAQRDSRELPDKHRAWLRYMLERSRFFALTGWQQSANTMILEAVEMARGTGHFDMFKEANALREEWGLQET